MDEREHNNALNSLWNFISADYETRLARSGKLNDFIDGGMDYFLGPTGIPNKARAANTMMNPIAQMGQAGADAVMASDPRFSRDERIGYGVNALTGSLATLAPAAFMRAAGRPAADAVMETLVNTSRPLAVDGISDAARRFAMSEDGSVPAARALTPQQEMAERILEMRAAGNAADVTDEMMAMADDVTMFNRTPLDMSVGARMQRAEDMGADPLTQFYHGTANGGFVDTTDINAFDPSRVGDRWNADSRGFSITSSPQDANYYAKPNDPGYGPDGLRNDNLRGGMVYPLEDLSSKPYNIKPKDSYEGTIGAWDNRPEDTYSKMDAAGADSARIYSDGVEMRVVMEPRNLRSRFARFDPEFAHLGNLSAGVAGLGVVGLGATQGQQTDDPYAQRNTLADVMRPAFGNALNGYTPPLPRNALQRGF